MADRRQTTAIILAAGAGKRMGTPKALMTVEGQPWWRMQADRLRAIGVPALWIINEQVAAAMQGDTPTRHALMDSSKPMLASALAGVQLLAADPPQGVFILPIDTPAPRPQVWADLAATNAVASPTVGGSSGHPLYAPWAWIADRLRTGSINPDTDRLDTLIAGDRVTVPTDDPDAITNLNRPEDLANWLERQRNES